MPHNINMNIQYHDKTLSRLIQKIMQICRAMSKHKMRDKMFISRKMENVLLTEQNDDDDDDAVK